MHTRSATLKCTRDAASDATVEQPEKRARTIIMDAPRVNVYSTTWLPACRHPEEATFHSELGRIGCVPGAVIATLSGQGLHNNRFRVDIYREEPNFLIGRSTEDVLLDMWRYTVSRTVSHRHARIRYSEELNRFLLDNLGRNGTRVNGLVVRSGTYAGGMAMLSHGDIINIGEIDMVFEIVGLATDEPAS